MLLARLVVEEGLPLRGLADRLGREARRARRARAASAVRSRAATSRMFSAVRASPSESATIAATASGSTSSPRRPRPRSGSPTRPADDRLELRLGQALEHVHAAAREERRDHLEGRVLGRRADQGHGAALDVRQERVLLGLVEAVDLVDEEDRALAAEREALRGLGDEAPDLLDAGEHGGERGEVRLGVRREQGGERRLPGARRSPEDHRVEVARLDGDAKEPPGSEEMRLADELVEALRPHPLGEGRRLAPTLARRLLEQLHAARPLASRPVVRRRGSRTAARRAARAARARLAQVRMPQRPRATKRSARRGRAGLATRPPCGATPAGGAGRGAPCAAPRRAGPARRDRRRRR